MMKSIEGIFKNGKVELLEPAPTDGESKVLVTFIRDKIDLQSRGIDQHQAAELRHRLSTFAEDWEQPEMDVYDEP